MIQGTRVISSWILCPCPLRVSGPDHHCPGRKWAMLDCKSGLSGCSPMAQPKVNTLGLSGCIGATQANSSGLLGYKSGWSGYIEASWVNIVGLLGCIAVTWANIVGSLGCSPATSGCTWASLANISVRSDCTSDWSGCTWAMLGCSSGLSGYSLGLLGCSLGSMG